MTRAVLDAITERARELADLPMRLLRRLAATGDDVQAAANREWRGATRGELVEEILDNEFSATVEDKEA